MRIAIGSEPRLLSILRSVVRFRAQEAGFADNQAERLAMAIDEAAANIIRHTYGGRPDDRLALEDLRPGGLGTLIIASFVDESSYDPEFKNGNRLKLVKYLSRKVPPCDEGSCSQSG